MANPTPGIPSDRIDQWVKTFEVVYALTDSAVKELNDTEAPETGILRKPCGSGLHIRKITREALRHNRALSVEVYNMALTGHLGFGREKGPVQFRKDVAEKLGAARIFQVISHDKPENVEEIEVDIEAIDHEAYAALMASAADHELEKKEKKHDTPSAPLPRATLLDSKKVTPAHQGSLAVRNLASGIISQLRADEEGRRKNAEQKKEYQEEIDRTKLKDRILKEEVKKEEIVATEKTKSTLRSNRNAGKPTHNK